MSQKTASDYLKKPNASGNFVASENGKEFLRGNSFVFHDANTEFVIIGNDGNKHWVAFSVPTSLEGDGPHTVPYPSGQLTWDVVISGESKPIQSGSVTVTFADHRKSVKGTVSLLLKKEGSEVTGNFKLDR
ncbi:hypothetical protein HU724_011530 [Pseudomonas iranensis]|uniref:hypothetical protein n=1 Tax=Pseudomonas iranensis TaxID=2745503 RepID=UPI001645B7FD|nr:hypothetical protein [Pseudomonas iranensis]QXI24868.1 hypothetical protein HU724_011530 [Pseudomonas iranensis]